MTFNVLAVCENGEETFPLYPVLNDEILVTGEALDGGFGQPIQVSRVVIRRKVGNSYRTVRETKDLSFQVWITASRIVFYCKKFEKGGGWVGWGLGGLAVAVVANSVSHAIAANRRKGKALVGNLRYPWISSVMFSPRTGFGTENDVRIAFVDGTDDSRPDCDITFTIERHNDANRVARHLVDRVIAYRYASGEEMDADEQRRFEELRTSGLASAPAKGQLTSYKIPSSWRVPLGMKKVPAAVPAFPPGPYAATAGAAVEASDVPVVEPPAPEALALPPAFCETCGSMELGENFCTDCGAPVVLAPA
jgi:hypothetical protein